MADEEDVARARDLVKDGGEVAAAVAAAGWLLLDSNVTPTEVLLAAGTPTAAGAVLRAAFDAARRNLSPRERVRVWAVLLYAESQARQRLMAGDNLREDGFFDPEQTGGRATSDEIAEAAVRVAEREPEERKIGHVGRLLANVMFKSCPFDRSTSNYMVRLARDLSYTQMQLLALVGRREEMPLPPERSDQPGQVSWAAATVRREFHDLGWGKRELFLPEQPSGADSLPLPWTLAAPKDQRLTTVGLGLYTTARLDLVPVSDLQHVAVNLWEASGHPVPAELIGNSPAGK